MKKSIRITILFFVVQQVIYAQSIKDSQINFYVTHLNFYPYNKILESIGTPDTLVFYEYPLTNDRNEHIPKLLQLIIYRKDSLWHGTSLIVFSKNHNKYTIWKMTMPIVLENRIFDEDITNMINEFNLIDYSEDISGYHTSIFVKQGAEMYSAWIIGNLSDFSKELPETAYVLSMGYFGSFNMKIVKKYKKRGYRF